MFTAYTYPTEILSRIRQSDGDDLQPCKFRVRENDSAMFTYHDGGRSGVSSKPSQAGNEQTAAAHCRSLQAIVLRDFYDTPRTCREPKYCPSPSGSHRFPDSLSRAHVYYTFAVPRHPRYNLRARYRALVEAPLLCGYAIITSDFILSRFAARTTARKTANRGRCLRCAIPPSSLVSLLSLSAL